jgi:hypothetical protein
LAYFRVEGTSRVSWSLLVEAATEDEASAIARRVAGRQSELRREFALQEVEHQVRRPLGLRLDEEPVNGRSSSGTAEREAAETGAARD